MIMEEISGIIDLIKDATEAHNNFNLFFTTEPIGEDGEDCFIRYGLPFEMRSEYGHIITLNRACERLIHSYKNIAYSDEGITFLRSLDSSFKNLMFRCDAGNRIYLVRRIINEASGLLNSNVWFDTYCLMEVIRVRGSILYHDKKTNEGIFIERENDTLEAFLAIEVSFWLLDSVEKLFRSIVKACDMWEIDMKAELSQKGEIGQFGRDILDIEESNYELPLEDSKGNNGEEAKIKMKCDVLTALFKAAGFPIPKNNKFASFISWLCGGSSEAIRQNGFSGHLADKEINTIKEKCKNVGLLYEKGKIEILQK